MCEEGEIMVKVYFGGCERPNAIHTLSKSGGKRVMISFAEPPTKTCWDLYRKYNIEIMADSGAFSAWKQGREIDINEYMEWILTNNIKHYFNLDVVGDSGATYINQVTMELAGFSPIPVFHFGEPVELLGVLIKKYTLIGLGGTVGLPTTTKEQWFRQIFSLYPEGKFHALGVTNARLIMQFPFDSVDSVWWVYKFQRQCKKIVARDG